MSLMFKSYHLTAGKREMFNITLESLVTEGQMNLSSVLDTSFKCQRGTSLNISFKLFLWFAPSLHQAVAHRSRVCFNPQRIAIRVRSFVENGGLLCDSDTKTEIQNFLILNNCRL